MNETSMDFAELKKRLEKPSRTNVIICGKTHTGKTDYLNYLVPPQYIIHTERHVRARKIAHLDYYKRYSDVPLIGIDEAQWVSLYFICEALRSPLSNVVLVYQDMPHVDYGMQMLFDDAIKINTDLIDLRLANIPDRLSDHRRFKPRPVISNSDK